MSAVECTPAVLRFVPTHAQLMQVMGRYYPFLLGLSSAILLLLILLYAETAYRVHRTLPSANKFTTTVVLSVYPVLGLCNYFSLIFPRSNVFMDAASQLWFSLCMMSFYKLTISYFGGESSMVESLGGQRLRWNGPPCCCWPCCWPLCPRAPINKRQVRNLRILVFQLVFVQAIAILLGLIMWLEGLYTVGDFSANNAYVYIFAFTTVSFLVGLWAFIVIFKSSVPQLGNFHYGKKIVAFQLTILFSRMQNMIFGTLLVPLGAIPCSPPISPGVYANIIQSALLLGQMLLLSVLARHFYLLPTSIPPLPLSGKSSSSHSSPPSSPPYSPCPSSRPLVVDPQSDPLGDDVERSSDDVTHSSLL